jgi:hypothetical protein
LKTYERLGMYLLDSTSLSKPIGFDRRYRLRYYFESPPVCSRYDRLLVALSVVFADQIDSKTKGITLMVEEYRPDVVH